MPSSTPAPRKPSSTELILSAGLRLIDDSLGHIPFTMQIFNALLSQRFRNNSNFQFTDGFDLDKHNHKQKIAELINNTTPPKKLFIPLATGGNHMTGLIVDIDKNGKADTLFFNSLGENKGGGSVYHKHAQEAIHLVRNKFPLGQNHVTTPKFQDYGNQDNFCGDWTLWFFEQAASKPSFSLQQISEQINHVNPNELPHGSHFRNINLARLEESYKNLGGTANTLSQRVVEKTRRQIEENRGNELEVKNGLFKNLEIVPRAIDVIQHAIKNLFLQHPAITNVKISTIDHSWSIPLKSPVQQQAEIRCINDQKLTITNLDPSDKGAVDAYVKSVKALAANRNPAIPFEKISISVTNLPPDLAVALHKAAIHNGLSTNISQATLHFNPQQANSRVVYSLGNGEVEKTPKLGNHFQEIKNKVVELRNGDANGAEVRENYTSPKPTPYKP